MLRGSDTTSVKDSIRNYRTLHGRTFHNYGETEYWFVPLEKLEMMLPLTKIQGARMMSLQMSSWILGILSMCMLSQLG